MTLAVYSRVRQLGRITLAGGKLAGSAAGVQDLADAAVRKAGGDAAKAYAALEGWTNGYLTVITDPAEQEAARQPHDGGAWTVTGQLPDGTNAALAWDGGLGAGWTDDATAWLAEAAAAGDVQGDNGTAVREWLQARGFYAAHGATPAGEGVEAAWDPELHPRDERGRFTTRGELLTRKPPAGTRRMAVTPGGIKAGDWLALGGRKGGYKVAAVEALPGDGTNPGPTRIHFEGGGRILLAWSYHQPRHGGVPVYRHAEEPRPHGKPPEVPKAEPGSPEALFTSMAGSYYIEKGVTPGQKQKIAAALAKLPARTRSEIKDFGLMRRISIRRHRWQDQAPEGTVTAIGSYNRDTRVLTIAADHLQVGQTTDHEAMHAWDRYPSGWSGRFSNQKDFKAIADQIRTANQHDPDLAGDHYAPFGGQGWLVKAGNAEMFAELAADYLAGYPYNLGAGRGTTRHQLPAGIRARLDRYFAGIFGGTTHQLTDQQKRQRTLTAAAADPTTDGGLGCVKITDDGWQFTDSDGNEISPATGERTGRAAAVPPPEPPGGGEGTAADDAGPAWTVAGKLPDGTQVTLSWDGGCAGWPDDALGWLLDGVAAGEVQGDDGPAVREWLQARGFTGTGPAAAGPDEARDSHGRWTTGGAISGEVAGAVDRNLARFAAHGQPVAAEPVQPAAISGYARQLGQMRTKLRSPAARRRWDADKGVQFTKFALDTRSHIPGTHVHVALDDHGGLAGAISFYVHREEDFPPFIHVDYLGTTGTAAGAGTALAVAVAKYAAARHMGVMGEEENPGAAVFWGKLGWHDDPLDLGATTFAGWTPEEAAEVAARDR